ncbi:hypothetical protein CA13_63670 [Planctomycetes bacterium CA13]|uniref:Uncharacterized protein n=1 Tax=Novipirellula herctigrandis TaxID=2527986 RepID=A0A5C5ZCK2_9BACT|nr:hypothetical protein CA13_63670 [Planctomycetes bacterium CA13]
MVFGGSGETTPISIARMNVRILRIDLVVEAGEYVTLPGREGNSSAFTIRNFVTTGTFSFGGHRNEIEFRCVTFELRKPLRVITHKVIRLILHSFCHHRLAVRLIGLQPRVVGTTLRRGS